MSYISLFNETIIEGGVQAAEFGSLTLTDESNQLTLNKTIINDEETVGRTITIPSTNEDCEFVLTSDVGQIIAGDNTFTGLNTFTQKTTFSNPTEGIAVDKIVEYTTDAGVDIDGMIIKDGRISFSNYGWIDPYGLLQADIDGSISSGSTFIREYQTLALTPTVDDASNLGSSSKRYRDIYAVAGIFNNLFNPSSGNITLWTDIIPQTTGSYSFGSDAFKFYRLYTEEIKLANSVIGYTGATATFNLPNYNSTTVFIVKDTTSGTQTINGLLILGGYTGSQYLKTDVTGQITGVTFIPNSDTTATSSSTPNTIVLRDSNSIFQCAAVNTRRIGSGTAAVDSTSIALGDLALNSVTTGVRNVAIGTQALQNAINAGYNTAIGYLAQNQTISSGFCTSVGQRAMYANTAGLYNTCVGHVSGEYLQGSFNTIIGSGSYSNPTTGSYNTIISGGAGYASSETNNLLICNDGTPGDNDIIRIGNSSHSFIYVPVLSSTGIVHASSVGLLTSSLIVNADVSGSAGISYTKLTLTNGIVNNDINSSAGITYSKLALTGSIVNADVSGSAGISYTKLTLTNGIVNNDINSSAGISYSKLDLVNSVKAADIDSETATNGYVLTADGSGNASWLVAGDGVNVTNTTSGSFYYPTFTDSTSGSGLTLRADSALQYNATSEVLQVTNTFTNIYVTNTTSSATWFPTFVSGGSNYFGLYASTSALSFQPSTGTLTATTFSGSLSGNATTATTTTNITLGATAGTLNYLLMSSATTGNQPIYTDTGITYNASTNNLSASIFTGGTFAGQLNGTISSGTTGTTQTASSNNTSIATTAYTDNQVNVGLQSIYTVLPQNLYVSGGYIVTGAGTGTYRMLNNAEASRTGGGNANAVIFNMVNTDIPTITGKTAKLRCRFTCINNNVASPMGAGATITAQLNEVTSVGGNTTNINYILGATNYGQVTFNVVTAAVVQNSTSSTFSLLSDGIYIFTFTNSAAVTTGNISLTGTLQLIYE